MRQLIFILLISLSTNVCHSQGNIWGQYSNHEGAYRFVDLRPDNIYFYEFGDRCGGIYRDSGIYKIIADTIFLNSNDKNTNQSKFFILKESNISMFIDTIINNTTKEKIPVFFWEPNTLVRMSSSDSILPRNLSGRLSDYEALCGGSYIKEAGYHENGNLSFKIQTSDKTKVITCYYANGRVKLIEHYYNDRKTGDWYFFMENGQIEKIETYKRNKLKRLKKNTL